MKRLEQSKRIFTLNPGDHFGELALRNNASRSCSIQAQELSTLAVLSKQSFLAITGVEGIRKEFEETTHFLRQTPAFMNADTKDLTVLASKLHAVVKPSGAVLVKQDDLCMHVFILKSGQTILKRNVSTEDVKILDFPSVMHQEITHLPPKLSVEVMKKRVPGEIMCLHEVLHHKGSIFTIEVAIPSKFLTCSASDFYEIFQNKPEILEMGGFETSAPNEKLLLRSHIERGLWKEYSEKVTTNTVVQKKIEEAKLFDIYIRHAPPETVHQRQIRYKNTDTLQKLSEYFKNKELVTQGLTKIDEAAELKHKMIHQMEGGKLTHKRNLLDQELRDSDDGPPEEYWEPNEKPVLLEDKSGDGQPHQKDEKKSPKAQRSSKYPLIGILNAEGDKTNKRVVSSQLVAAGEPEFSGAAAPIQNKRGAQTKTNLHAWFDDSVLEVNPPDKSPGGSEGPNKPAVVVPIPKPQQTLLAPRQPPKPILRQKSTMLFDSSVNVGDLSVSEVRPTGGRLQVPKQSKMLRPITYLELEEAENSPEHPTQSQNNISNIQNVTSNSQSKWKSTGTFLFASVAGEGKRGALPAPNQNLRSVAKNIVPEDKFLDQILAGQAVENTQRMHRLVSPSTTKMMRLQLSKVKQEKEDQNVAIEAQLTKVLYTVREPKRQWWSVPENITGISKTKPGVFRVRAEAIKKVRARRNIGSDHTSQPGYDCSELMSPRERPLRVNPKLNMTEQFLNQANKDQKQGQMSAMELAALDILKSQMNSRTNFTSQEDFQQFANYYLKKKAELHKKYQEPKDKLRQERMLSEATDELMSPLSSPGSKTGGLRGKILNHLESK